MDQHILLKHHGIQEILPKGTILFKQGEKAKFFFYILSGAVRIFSQSEGGKEFTQKIFLKGESFGIPPLFIEEYYPSSAETNCQVEVIKLHKNDFFTLLDQHPIYYKSIVKSLSELLYYKSIMTSEISMQTPEHRILTLFKQLKTTTDIEKINLTRQQIANLTALRIETVIRHIKCMEERGILIIKDRKVYY